MSAAVCASPALSLLPPAPRALHPPTTPPAPRRRRCWWTGWTACRIRCGASTPATTCGEHTIHAGSHDSLNPNIDCRLALGLARRRAGTPPPDGATGGLPNHPRIAPYSTPPPTRPSTAGLWPPSTSPTPVREGGWRGLQRSGWGVLAGRPGAPLRSGHARPRHSPSWPCLLSPPAAPLGFMAFSLATALYMTSQVRHG